MVDIVITYLNSNRTEWQKNYYYYQDKEAKEGSIDLQDRQVSGIERIRDWNNLHYWFRGVEQNCSWVNKIFLVVQSEDQLPRWLNQDHPKLRIVTHDEFIPKKLLPTFNAFTIELFLHKIKDLNEQYLLCNDDHFFISPIKETMFFENGCPKQPEKKMPWGLYPTGTSDGTFYAVLNNGRLLEKEIIEELYPGQELWTYDFTHLPYPRLKSMDKQIFDRFKDKIIKGASYSRFRNPHNYSSMLFDDALKIYNKTIIDNDMFNNSAYMALKSTLNLNYYLNSDVVCFNDTEQLDDFKTTKENLDKFFKRKFPNKSSFEK